MAFHGKSYGFSAEVAAKHQAKYDPAMEASLRRWIEGTTHKSIGGDFQAGLKDGVILCELINAVRPGTVRKINTSTMPFKCMENIQNFLGGCRSVGVNDCDLFAVVDLYEAKNMTLVLQGLSALARVGGGRGGPKFIPPGGSSVGNINSAGSSPARGGSNTNYGSSSPGVSTTTGSSNSGLYGAKYGGGASASGNSAPKPVTSPQPKYGTGATYGSSSSSPKTTTTSSSGSAPKFCPECGSKRASDTAKFCGECGYKFF